MFFVQACSFKNGIDSVYYCQKFKLSCIQSNKVVYFKTSKGDFEVKLFGKDNPVTVSNFLENIDNNIYVNQKFYKIINFCLLYTSPSPRDGIGSRMPSSA